MVHIQLINQTGHICISKHTEIPVIPGISQNKALIGLYIQIREERIIELTCSIDTPSIERQRFLGISTAPTPKDLYPSWRAEVGIIRLQ